GATQGARGSRARRTAALVERAPRAGGATPWGREWGFGEERSGGDPIRGAGPRSSRTCLQGPTGEPPSRGTSGRGARNGEPSAFLASRPEPSSVASRTGTTPTAAISRPGTGHRGRAFTAVSEGARGGRGATAKGPPPGGDG